MRDLERELNENIVCVVHIDRWRGYCSRYRPLHTYMYMYSYTSFGRSLYFTTIVFSLGDLTEGRRLVRPLLTKCFLILCDFFVVDNLENYKVRVSPRTPLFFVQTILILNRFINIIVYSFGNRKLVEWSLMWSKFSKNCPSYRSVRSMSDLPREV